MTIITIPKHLAHGDFMLITREEYEAIKRVCKTFRTAKTQKQGQVVKVKHPGPHTY